MRFPLLLFFLISFGGINPTISFCNNLQSTKELESKASQYYNKGLLDSTLKYYHCLANSYKSSDINNSIIWIKIALLNLEQNKASMANAALKSAQESQKLQPNEFIRNTIILIKDLKNNCLQDSRIKSYFAKYKSVLNEPHRSNLYLLLIYNLIKYDLVENKPDVSWIKKELSEQKKNIPEFSYPNAKLLLLEAGTSLFEYNYEEVSKKMILSFNILNQLNSFTPINLKEFLTLLKKLDGNHVNFYPLFDILQKKAHQFGDNNSEAIILYQKSQYYFEKSDLFMAEKLMDQALLIYNNKNPEFLFQMACINGAKENYTKAFEYYAKLLKYKNYYVRGITGCALFSFRLKDKKKFSFYKALLNNEISKNNINNNDLPLINMLYNQTDSKLSTHYSNKYLKYLEDGYPKSKYLCNLRLTRGNEAWFNNNDYKNALEEYQKAILSILPNEKNANPYIELNLNPCINPSLLILALNNKGEAFYQLSKQADTRQEKIKNLRACYDNLLLSIDQMYLFKMQQTSEEEKYIYSNLKAHRYPNIIKVCLELYNLTKNSFYKNEAFRFAEQSKASVLLEILRSNNGFLVGMIPKELKQKEDSITTAISLIRNSYKGLSDETNTSLLSKMNILVKEKEEIENTYKDKYPDYYKLKYSHESVTPNKIQKSLSKNECVIEYLLSRNFLITYYLDNKHFIVTTDTLSKVNLNELATKYYHRISKYNEESYHHDSIETFAKTSNQLYNILIKPFKKYIGNKDLIIVGDNALNRIPFETLIPFIPPNITSYKNLPYLAKSNSVNYVPSATLLMELKEKPKLSTRTRLLAMAPIHTKLKVRDNITNILLAVRSDTSLLNILPNALNEVNYAHKTAGGSVLSGENASETNFKKLAQNYDLLHLATHGMLDTVSPLMSKLIFSNTNEKNEDGLLHLYEIYNLHQSAQLVILSACNTGSGENYSGEGVINLARGFLSSGSRSVIMTGWSVNDQSSYELMKSFYDHLKDQRNISETLNNSKLEYLQKADNLHSHPYFWAGYQVYGDASVELNVYNNNKLYLILGILGFLTVIVVGTYKFKLVSSLTRKLYPYKKSAC